MSMPKTSPRKSAKAKFGKKKVGAKKTGCPTPAVLHFHLDANRDGTVDDDWTLNNIWLPGTGKGKRGAIMLCNCDDEDGDKKEDNFNEKIDTADDNSDIAPLFLRKHPKGCPIPSGWRAVLEVSEDHAKCIRIFDKNVAGGKEILGLAKGMTFEITDFSPDEWKFGIEATQYPGRMKRDPTDPKAGPLGVGIIGDNWDGYVDLKITLVDGAGAEQASEKAKIRCAPWVIFNHFDPTEQLYVVNTGDNTLFLDELKKAVAGVPLDDSWSDPVRWMQDVMEPGFSTLPKPKGFKGEPHLRVPILTANARTLAMQVSDKLLDKNYGVYQVLDFVPLGPRGSFPSQDSFGNLECVPPFTHPTTKKKYKFGRIVYGHGAPPAHVGMREEVIEFLDHQKVQFPFSVDTGWLSVGHVDEVFSFLPLKSKSAPMGFKILIAAPKLALDIVTRVNGVDPNAPMFQYASGLEPIDGPDKTLPGERTVGQVLANSSLVSAQTYAQTKIDGIRTSLKNEIGVEDSDFIELPVLFQGNRIGESIAFTAGSVNMLVVTKGARTLKGSRTVQLAVPRPFGPILGGKCQFELAIEKALTLPGVSFEFVDDFYTYHNLAGEIHCGTNSLRQGATDRFWWQQMDI
jgi:Protein-arginine deiminase (PAD)/Protein-arginine deiminase (PAD) middle domain